MQPPYNAAFFCQKENINEIKDYNKHNRIRFYCSNCIKPVAIQRFDGG